MKRTLAVVSSLLACQFAFAQETLQTVTARGDVSNGDITVNGRLKIASTNISMIGVGGVDYLDFRGVNDSPILRFNRNSLDAYFMNGNVGVGTTTPIDRLHVIMSGSTNGTGISVSAVNSGGGGSQPSIAFLNSSNLKRWATGLDVYSDIYQIVNAAGTSALSVTQSGNVGIGTTNPLLKFVTNVGTEINWGITSGTNGLYPALRAMNNAANAFVHAEIDASVLTLNAVSGGNVGIGTTSPAERLSVNGKIRAKEIKVETANWPDYVFANTYSIRSLGDLERYIQTNKHLPEIPSAEEVNKNGIELGEMNAKLLKKIEELTLYMIEQNREIKVLKEEVRMIRNNSPVSKPIK